MLQIKETVSSRIKSEQNETLPQFIINSLLTSLRFLQLKKITQEQRYHPFCSLALYTMDLHENHNYRDSENNLSKIVYIQMKYIFC